MAGRRTLDSVVLRPHGRDLYLGIVVALDVLAWGMVGLMIVRWGGIDGVSVLVLVMSLLLLLRMLRAGVELVPSGMRVFRLIRTEHIPWSEIKDIDIRSSWAGRQVRLVLRSGKVVKLPAPGEWWPATSSGLNDEVDLVKQRCAPHRS